jgi:triacylglycerol lipase
MDKDDAPLSSGRSLLPERLSEAGTNLTSWVRDYGYALRWQANGLVRPPDPQQYRMPNPEKPAVVLLPGIYETWAFMLPVADLLRAHGYDVRAVVELGYNGGTIEDMTNLVQHHIREEGIGRCVLVAHSKGGLIGKLMLARHNEPGLINGLVALNTPFEGSPLARLLPLPAIRTFLPRSPELTELGGNHHVHQEIVSIYGRFDPHIPGGSHLPGAHNVRLETRGHFLPLGDARVHEAILDGIRLLTR